MQKKTKFIIAIAIIVILIASTYAYTVLQKKEYYVVDFNEDRAYKDEKKLVSFGPRFTGTANEYSTAKYIAEEFEKAGLSDVKIEQYESTLYEVINAEFSLRIYYRVDTPLGPIEYEKSRTDYVHKEEFILQAYSGSTDGEQSFDIVNAGNGTDEAYQGIDVQGKAVIVTNDGRDKNNTTLSNTQLLLNAHKYGAVVNIIHNVRFNKDNDYAPISVGAFAPSEDGKHSIPFPDKYPDIKIPSLMVSKGVGDEINDAINNSDSFNYPKVVLNFDVPIEKRKLSVVVGDVKGKTDKIVMIGGHHDNVYVNVGAVDNACGTATVIEMARNVAKYTPQYTIRFATFGGEEQGLFGSYEYYKAHKEELHSKLVIYLNLDMPNVGPKGETMWIGVSNGNYLDGMNKAKDSVLNKYPNLEEKYNITVAQDPLQSSSDMATFSVEGMDVSALFGSGESGYHTPKDTIENVNPESLKLAGMIYSTFVVNL